MAAPLDLEKVAEKDRDYLLGFSNTEFVPAVNRERSLAAPLSRLELAYFIAQLVPKKESVTMGKEWAEHAIQFVTQNHLMATYPDGKFRPTESVKTIEYVITLVRALKLDIPTDNIKLPYADVDTGHWTARYVAAAYNAGVLPKSTTLAPNTPLRRDLFMAYAAYMPPVRSAIETVLSFSAGFAPTETIIAQYDSVWKATYVANKAMMNAPFVITWTSPSQPTAAIYNTDKVTLRGKITPPMAFSVNGQTVMTAQSGEFAFTVALNMGANGVTIMGRNNQQERLSLLRLPAYSDLKGHWISQEASELAAADAWPSASPFLPKAPVTRVFLAQVLKLALNLPVPQNTMAVTDVPHSGPTWDSVQAVLAAGIMQTKDGQFRPREVMNRAGVMTALSRTVSDQPQVITANFVDVPPRHWGYVHIQKALNAGLVSDGRYFYPLRGMTRAELAAVVYKLSPVQGRIAEVLKSQ